MTSTHPPPRGGADHRHEQLSLEDLGLPLAETTFTVVDLETTGTRAADGGITEIGAVKVRGGEVVGEFATLVDPGRPIPPYITLLTGITEAMVATAPTVEAVLPQFLEFLGDAVLVAHNAAFDTGFLKAACAAHDYAWPAPAVVDTVALARKLVPRSEVGNHKLATLARYFSTPSQPQHRALDDARATVGVLHALFERLGAFGVDTLEELRAFAGGPAPTAAQRRKRTLAADLPTGPGVYIFEDAAGKALYIGKSANLRKRVGTYFTRGERRGRVREMLALAEHVRPIVCGTAVEAEVRELRLIAERDPPYNRRSRRPERACWLRLTDEPFPRLSIVQGLRDNGPHLGPFPSRNQAELARDALHQAFPLRQCTQRLRPGRPSPACVLAELHRCGAPCQGGESPEQYARHVADVQQAMTTTAGPVVTSLRAHIDRLAAQQRYEEAAAHRDRLAAYLTGASRAQQLSALAGCSQLVAARPLAAGDAPAAARHELCVIRHGRLAASTTTRQGSDVRAAVTALVATAETVTADTGGASAAGPQRTGPLETECLLRWLNQPDVRLVDIEGTWTSPADGAQGYAERMPDWHTWQPSR